jgi:hypothetical protein
MHRLLVTASPYKYLSADNGSCVGHSNRSNTGVTSSNPSRLKDVRRYIQELVLLVEKQHKGLWQQNSLDLLTK